jgi:hypothetical protein
MPDVQQQIARLESLLTRIRANAAKARVATAPLAIVPPAGTDAIGAYAAAPDSGPPTDRTDAEDRALASPTVAEITVPVEVEELDMADEELVELSVDVSVVAEGAAEESIEQSPPPLANELVEEPAPESAPRPATQAAEEADLEPPVKTPPPESGRQVVAVPVGIAGEAELEEAQAAALEPDLSAGAISLPLSDEPSVSQLGETVELEGADGPAAKIELLSAPMHLDAPEPADDLEMSLPQQRFGGAYQADLAPPSGASGDLARHREQAEAAQNPPTQPPTSLASPAEPDVLAAPVATIAMGAVVAPQQQAASPLVVERPTLGSLPVVQMHRSSPATLPNTFVELLDASLSIEA